VAAPPLRQSTRPSVLDTSRRHRYCARNAPRGGRCRVTPALHWHEKGLDAMDTLAPLATQLAAILTPFLPQLIKSGQAIAEGVADQVDKQKSSLAEALWARLFPKVSSAPAADEAVKDAAANPEDADYQAALRIQLRKLLTDDTELAGDLQGLLERAKGDAGTVNVSAGGERSVAVGGSVQGSTIVTGDRNRLSE
jgi:hypothetical protein